MNGEVLLSVAVGVALAAACGFRVFVPLLVASLAAHTGHLALAPGFEWIASTPALVAFGVATVLEIAGYYVPWVDHALDVLATPVAAIAGTLAVGSTVAVESPFLHWTLALVAGGGIASGIQILTGLARLGSTAATGGLGNPLVATVEAGASLALSLLAILVPVVAAFGLALLVAVALVALRRRKVLTRGARPGSPPSSAASSPPRG